MPVCSSPYSAGQMAGRMALTASGRPAIMRRSVRRRLASTGRHTRARARCRTPKTWGQGCQLTSLQRHGGPETAVAEAVLVLQPRQQCLPEIPNVEDAKAWWDPSLRRGPATSLLGQEAEGRPVAEQVPGQGLLWMSLCTCGRAGRLHLGRRRGCQPEMLKPSVWAAVRVYIRVLPKRVACCPVAE